MSTAIWWVWRIFVCWSVATTFGWIVVSAVRGETPQSFSDPAALPAQIPIFIALFGIVWLLRRHELRESTAAERTLDDA